ncbi:MAG: hypothetical protein CMQ19_13970 [Gammaproteobacteria bacterium]|nr:hypothetical protein [Gammaproteobacteria bacterium]
MSGIVCQHKGFIEVKSSEGKGAEFTIYFPVVLLHDLVQKTGSGSRSPHGEVKGRILLADDDARIRCLIASILERDGFHLTSVEDGKEAKKLIIG